ncbi:MAG: alkaline phosphatase family protein [Acidobacteriota bacterium]
MKELDRREFIKLGLATGSLAVIGDGGEIVAKVLGKRESSVKVIVLGFDGMDPLIVGTLMEQGRLPHFQKLRSEGGYRPLRTSIPPQSPVAWSNFITGTNPGGHAIYDFIHRNPDNYFPYLSTSRTEGASKTIKIGNYVLPISGGKVELLRKGRAFWQILEDHDIPATIFKIPSNFPPAETKQRTISGMGTPDIVGSYGIFNFYTTEPTEMKPDIGGGKIHLVRVYNNKVEAQLPGPKNSFKKDNPTSGIKFTVYIDPWNPVAKVAIQDHEFILREKEWSAWKRISFKMIPTQSVSGICKFYLKEAHPRFKLYISAVNIDPAAPALPISTPESYAEELEKKFGPFYTKGLPADTNALDHGVLDDEEFLQQDQEVHEESLKMYDYELNRFESGLLFYYISSTDQRQHMFWRLIDKQHPAHDPILAVKHGSAIEDIYVEMDKILAKTIEKVDKDTVIMVMSDHGFASYRRSFNLNTWLKENAYMKLIDSRRQEDFEFFLNTDWLRTRAYALGLNGLYINLKGREGKGVVEQSEKENLVREIARKLEQVVDPLTGDKVINRAYVATDVYQGPYVNEAPDIVVGYNRGYRCSWATPLGRLPKPLLEDNLEKWSGDHCMDPELIPGVIFSNRRIAMESPSLYDLTATILHLFGIEKPKEMIGRNIF